MSSRDIAFYAAHRPDCPYEPGHWRADGITVPCTCGLLDMLAGRPVPGAPPARVDAMRRYACHLSTCAWRLGIKTDAGPAFAADDGCTCGLSDLLARLRPPKPWKVAAQGAGR